MVHQINAKSFYERLNNDEIAIIDVREPDEKPAATFTHTKIPLSVFTQHIDTITQNKVILFCHSGVRSLLAGELLAEHFGNTKIIYNLKGGILSL